MLQSLVPYFNPHNGSNHNQVYRKICSSILKPSFFCQMRKHSSKVLFKLDLFHGALYCCVSYSNMKYEDETFKIDHDEYYSKVMAKIGFGCRFHGLRFF